jgi:hypothetical protein
MGASRVAVTCWRVTALLLLSCRIHWLGITYHMLLLGAGRSRLLHAMHGPAGRTCAPWHVAACWSLARPQPSLAQAVSLVLQLVTMVQ